MASDLLIWPLVFTFRNTQFNILLNMWQSSLISPLPKTIYPCTFLIYLTFSCEMISCLHQIKPASSQGNSKAHYKFYSSMHRNFYSVVRWKNKACHLISFLPPSYALSMQRLEFLQWVWVLYGLLYCGVRMTSLKYHLESS